MQTRLLFLHVLSPLHVGTGQGVGVIDLPVAREKPTGIPIVPGSSLKGVLRAQVADKDLCKRVFGPETDVAYEHAGSVQFGDLYLLFLPVRSLRGTFAWVTSPFLLQRFARDVAWVQNGLVFPQVPQVAQENRCLVPAQLTSHLLLDRAARVILEDLDLQAQMEQNLDQWATTLAPLAFPNDGTWQTHFKERICVVHDDVLAFLLETALEVTARVRLKEDTKTVARGALWYEEALPAESILYGVVVIAPVKATAEEVDQVLQSATRQSIQLGGDATVGRGLCRLNLL